MGKIVSKKIESKKFYPVNLLVDLEETPDILVIEDKLKDINDLFTVSERLNLDQNFPTWRALRANSETESFDPSELEES